MQNVRIIELPSVKAVYSGPLVDDETFFRFNSWFTAYHSGLKNELYPRDFMRYNESIGAREWFYVLPCDAENVDCGDFSVCELPGGLYAVAPCLDADIDDANDWLKTRRELIDWAEKSERFEAYMNVTGKPERYPLFHIVSPGRMIEEGISIEDFYLPITEKGKN